MTDFNGTTLRVTLDAPTGGFLTVEAQNALYSDWKEWLKTNAAQAPQLFDIIGGDPIPGGQSISPSYFVRNDLGWRIQSTDEDQEVDIIGNLYPRDASIPMFVARPGRQVVLKLALTANPRDLSSAKIDDIHGQVQREVWIDTNYPTNGNFGYQQQPFNSWTDGVDYAEANNLLTLALKDDATVDRQIRNFEVRGISFPDLDLNGQDMDGTTVRRCNINGVHLGMLLAEDIGLTNVTGEVLAQRVGVAGTYSIRDSAFSLMSDVNILTPGTPFIIDLLAGAAGSTLGLNNVSGGLQVRNVDHADDEVHIHMSQGQVTLEASCTAGSIVITGNAELIDNSSGSTVVKDALSEPSDARLARKRLMNREFTNPSTNKLEQYDDADVGIEHSADIFKDDGVTPWDGTGPIQRRNQMT